MYLPLFVPAYERNEAREAMRAEEELSVLVGHNKDTVVISLMLNGYR